MGTIFFHNNPADKSSDTGGNITSFAEVTNNKQCENFQVSSLHGLRFVK